MTFKSTCPSLTRIAEQHVGDIGGDVARQLESFFASAQRQQLGGVAHGLPQFELGPLEIEPTRLDFREIENVVDQFEQRIGRGLHRRQVVTLFARQLGLQGQRRHAEDRVQRRPDLMTHVGEEGTLRFGRFFRTPLRQLELLDELRESCRLVLELSLRRLELARVGGHRLFRGLALGDVASGRVEHLLLRVRRGCPEQPTYRAVFVEIAVFEVEHLLSGVQLLGFGNRGLAIVGMHEVHVRLRQQLRFAVAQDAVPRRIDAFEIAVESGDAQHVERQCEEPIELFLRVSAIDEQPNLVAHTREHREQAFIGRADFAAEKLHHAQNFAAKENREAEGAVQPFTSGDWRSREIGVFYDIGDPVGLTRGPDPPRKSDAARE